MGSEIRKASLEDIHGTFGFGSLSTCMYGDIQFNTMTTIELKEALRTETRSKKIFSTFVFNKDALRSLKTANLLFCPIW